MRKILSTFLICFNVYAAPFAGVKNETATVKTYAQDFTLPNNQATKMAGLDTRIETGNNNLLVNPSFEHSTVGFGWTISNATATADTTNQVDGKKALSLALTGALSVIQDSTINAANLVGLQGNASIKIKTSDVDGLKVCARNAGVTSTSLCVNIPKDGAWKEINIPYILTATSNGIAITSTGTTGTVKLDDAFVGTSAPFQGVSGAKLVGTLNYSPTANCIWQTTSATFANFSADTDCSTPTVTGNIKAPSTKIPAIVLPAGSQSGTYLITAKAMFYKGTAGYASYRFSDGTNSVNSGSSSYADNTATGIISGQITYSTSINSDTTIQIQGKTATGNLSVYANDTTDGLSFEVYYFPPESKIYSQASQDYDWTSYTPAFTGLGTTTSVSFWHKREGSDLLIRGNFVTGTVTATTPSLSLPSGLTIDTTKVPSVVSICSVAQRGNSAATGSQYTNYIAINPSTPTVLKFATGNNSLSGTNEITNSTISFANSETQSIATCRIPIQGWQDYGVIVGSFREVPKVPGQNNVDIFSVSYGTTNATTVCSASPCSYLDQIGNAVSSITRSGAGSYALNTTKTYAKLKCVYSGDGSGGYVTQGLGLSCSSCSSMSFNTRTSQTNTVNDSYGTLYCQGSY